MRNHLRIKRLLMAALCAAVTVLPFWGYYVHWAAASLQRPVQEDVIITAVDPSGTAKGTALHMEVRRGGVAMDPVKFLEEASAVGEWYAEDGVLHVDTLDTPLRLCLPQPNTYEFYFDSFLDSPSVKIECAHGSSIYDLYHGNYYYHQYRVVSGSEGHQAPDVSLSRRLSESIVLAAILILTALCWRTRASLTWICYGVTLMGLVFTAVLLRQYSAGYAIVLLFSAASAIALRRCEALQKSAVRFGRGWLLAGMVFLCLYTSFALYGNRLFLELPTLQLTLRSLCMFWMLAVITAPMLYLAVAALVLAHQKVLEKQRCAHVPAKRSVQRTRLLCAAVIIVPLAVVLIGFYPCVTSSDGTGYWNRGLGIDPIGQPFGYTMLLKALAALSPNPLVYAVMQIALFAFAISGILSLLYRRGLPRWCAVCIALLTAVIPGNYMNAILLSTNAFIAVLLLYVLYLLAQLADDPLQSARRPCWLIQMAAAGLVLGYTRRNSMPSMLAVLAVLGWFAWAYRRQIGKRLAALLTVMVLLSCLISGAEDRMLAQANAADANGGTIARFLFKPVVAAYVSGAELPDETMALADRVLEEQWLEMYYDPHHSDPLTMSPYYTPEGETTSVYLHTFLDTLKRFPAAVVKDLMDQSELAWCVFECPTSWNLRYRTNVDGYLLPQDSWVPPSPFPQASRLINQAALNLAEAAAAVPVLDSLFYRAGVYMILFIVQAGALIGKRRWQMLLLSLPALALEATTFIAASFPFFEYHWFWVLTIPFFMLICLFVDERPKGKAS